MQSVKREFHGKELILETGVMAKQASGAVVVKYGDITVLSTTVGAKKANLEQDFFPLTVNYNEKYYAGGKIPGGFLRREGRPRDKETLISRIIDRPIRPLFPEGFRNEVQVIPTVLSTDQMTPTDVFGLIGASASTVLSWIPFNGPVAAIRIGMKDGEFIINPNFIEIEEGDLDIIVAGSKDAILMIEGDANEVSEETFINALELAHKEMQPIIEMQEELAKLAGQEKLEVELFKYDEELEKDVWAFAEEKMKAANSNSDKVARNENVEAVYEETKKHFVEEKEIDEKLAPQIGMILHDIEEKIVRHGIVEEESRPDGRSLDEIRPISVDIDILPKVHGSALFTRGQTQALAIITLGSDKDAQLLDDVNGKEDKDFMLHYNFPPFSVGETGRFGSPGRREIGHGNLAERSFYSVRPDRDEFPYTIRIVSEILESNGSSSMASICAGSMALMNAGVPLRSNVAGIAMGLVTNGDKYKVLTDIQGVEDHLGDMDFKVAGTAKGITAFQLDIKLTGISKEILEEALGQAKKARLEILEKLDGAIKEAGALPPAAPRYKKITVKQERIRDLIGPGGKNVKWIVEETGSDVSIEDDGTVNIFSQDDEGMKRTLELIESFTKVPEPGEFYDGVIAEVRDFGFIIELLPGIKGMCHISELEYHRVENIYDYANEGDTLYVKVLDVTEDGKRIALSHKATMEPPEGYTPPPPKPKGGGRGGRDRDRGGRDRDRGRGRR